MGDETQQNDLRKSLQQAADAIRNCAVAAAARDACVSKLVLVVKNILDNPNEAKYRRLLASSGAFKEINNISGGLAFLVALGFRKKVHEFREYWTLECHGAGGDAMNEEDIAALQIAKEIIVRAQNVLRERVEAEQRQKFERDNDERLRREQALARIQEDRLRRIQQQELRGNAS